MTDFNVASRREQGAFVVTPEGELDIATVDPVRELLLQRADGEALVVDLRHVTFLDTSGIQVVVEAYRASNEDGFTLRILRADPRVHRVFEIAGLDGVLPFEDADA